MVHYRGLASPAQVLGPHPKTLWRQTQSIERLARAKVRVRRHECCRQTDTIYSELGLYTKVFSQSHRYRQFSLEVCKNLSARAPIVGRPIAYRRNGARGEATSSEFQLIAYQCYVRISKHPPSTICHGQGLA